MLSRGNIRLFVGREVRNELGLPLTRTFALLRIATSDLSHKGRGIQRHNLVFSCHKNKVGQLVRIPLPLWALLNKYLSSHPFVFIIKNVVIARNEVTKQSKHNNHARMACICFLEKIRFIPSEYVFALDCFPRLFAGVAMTTTYCFLNIKCIE
jgi:hypothetical protein